MVKKIRKLKNEGGERRTEAKAAWGGGEHKLPLCVNRRKSLVLPMPLIIYLCD